MNERKGLLDIKKAILMLKIRATKAKAALLGVDLPSCDSAFYEAVRRSVRVEESEIKKDDLPDYIANIFDQLVFVESKMDLLSGELDDSKGLLCEIEDALGMHSGSRFRDPLSAAKWITRNFSAVMSCRNFAGSSWTIHDREDNRVVYSRRKDVSADVLLNVYIHEPRAVAFRHGRLAWEGYVETGTEREMLDSAALAFAMHDAINAYDRGVEAGILEITSEQSLRRMTNEHA